jgi:hypothetical protein
MEEVDIFQLMDSLGLNPGLVEEYYPRLLEPIGKPTQLGLTPREFFYWTDKGVIDVPKSEDGQSPWSRLNLFEILWIRIVQDLRTFNIPFSAIVELKHDVFRNLLDLAGENSEMFYRQVEENFPDEMAKEFAKHLLQNSNSVYDELGVNNKLLFTYMGVIFTEILLHQKTISLIVFKNKDEFDFTFEGGLNQHEYQDEIDLAKSKTHLILNIRNIVAEYILEPKLESLNDEFGFISDEEKELIRVIRDKQVKEIHIKKDDNEVLTYIATSKREIKDDQVAAIKRLLRMNEFDDVRVVLRNDKHLYIENKKKIKIRPGKTAQKKNKN